MMKKRRLLVKLLHYAFIGIIILATIAIAVGAIFYASGYKINWKTRQIQKTGILIINYQGDDLEFFIDDKPVSPEQRWNPIFLSSRYSLQMLPGEYGLKIKKEGFRTYRESIVIKPELLTKIESLILIPNEIKKEEVFRTQLKSYLLSPDSTKVVFQNQNDQIFIHNLVSDTYQILGEEIQKGELSSYLWSNDSKKLIIKNVFNQNPYYFLVDPENVQNTYSIKDRYSFFPFFGEIYFSPTSNDELLGLNSQGELYRISPSKNILTKLFDNVDKVFINHKSAYFFDSKSLGIFEIDSTNFGKNLVLENFIPADDFSITNISSGRYIKDNKTLYLVKDKNLIEVLSRDVDWIKETGDKTNMLFTKNFEIWIFDSGKKKTKMITRFSQKIKNLEEIYKGQHIFYHFASEIGIIRADGRVDQLVEKNENLIEARYLENEKDKILTVEKDGQATVFTKIDLEM